MAAQQMDNPLLLLFVCLQLHCINNISTIFTHGWWIEYIIKTCHLFTAAATADELLLVDGGRGEAYQDYMDNYGAPFVA